MRKYFLMLIDISLLIAAFFTAFFIRFDYSIPYKFVVDCEHSLFMFVTIVFLTLILSKQYSKVWRYASLNDLVKLTMFITIGSIAAAIPLYILKENFPRSIYLLSWLLSIIFIDASRVFYRITTQSSNNKIDDLSFKKVLLVGGGTAAQMLIKELKNHPELKMKPVAIVDDDKSKLYRMVEGVPIKARIDEISKVIKQEKIDEVIFVIPSAPKNLLKKVINKCSELHIKVKTIPGIYELVNGKVSIKHIRDVDIKDLLGRKPIEVNLKEISAYISNKKILITGGGGSIGSELCRQISKFSLSQLIIIDIYENNMYDIQQELKRKYPELNITCLVASVRDKKRLSKIFEQYKPNIVFHAAAHKHVPLMEDSPNEAIKNNVYGTLNLIQIADQYDVEKFVMISTDKAVNPTSVMGATKRIGEMLIQSFNKISKTEFVAVRFGNVLGSNGSVIPLFKQQILEGGPVTVTHEDVKRYFMTIPEAVQLVIQSGAMAKGGEIFVLDMGEPVKIIDLARDLIRLSGFEPDVDIPIKIIGLRPGEKMFEELLITDDRFNSTKHGKILIEKPMFDNYSGLIQSLEKYRSKVDDMTIDEIKQFIKSIVPNYVSSN